MKISRSAIKNVLNKNYNNITAGGYAWEYVDEKNIKYTKEYKDLKEFNKHKNKKEKVIKINYKKIYNDKIKSEILSLYDKGLSPIEIIRLGYAGTTVRRNLEKYRDYIPEQAINEEDKKIRNSRIIELYLKNYKNCEIERELGLTRSVVQKTISKYIKRKEVM
jgi:hypothetical protein